jgi:hypothetical protein
MAGDPFTSSIFRWLNAVAADSTLPPAAFKLAYVISQHINRHSHVAWPSQKTLASAIGVETERTVGRLLVALEDGGHLLTTQRKQTSQLYRLAQDRTELSYLDEPPESSGNEPRPDENVGSCDQDQTILTPRPDIPDAKTGQKCPPNHLNNHLRNQEGERRARATLLQDDFRLDDQTYGWALDRLGSNEAVNRSVSRFVNHYRQVTGDRSKSRDWQAKARNWIDDDANKAAPDKSVIQIAGIEAIPDRHWDGILSTYVKTGRWTRHVDQCGSEPPSPDCRAPRHLLIKHGIVKENAA